MSETGNVEPSSDPVKENDEKFEIETSDGSSPPISDDGDTVHIPLYVQIPWVVGALIGLCAHVYMTTKDAFPTHPLADGITLAWLAFVVIGASVNYVREIGLPGGGKLSFRRLERTQRALEEERVSAESLTVVVNRYASQLQSWTNSVNLLTQQLQRYGKTDEDKDAIVTRYCLERMEEAKQIIGEEDDTLRISLWWYLEEVGGLMLIVSEDIRDEQTLNHVFQPGGGLCGQCYVEGRYYNLEDAPRSIYYQPIIDAPSYHGLLLVPVQSGTGPILGVLSIDRSKAEKFEEPAAVDVARALSDLLAYALTHPDANSIYAPGTTPPVLAE